MALGMPPVGAGTAPGQPPFGPQSVQQPTPNPGLGVAAVGQITWAVKLLETALPLVGASSEIGKDVMKALQSLTKHVQGPELPGVDNTTLQNAAMANTKDQGLMQLLRGQDMGAAGAPPPGATAAPSGVPING